MKKWISLILANAFAILALLYFLDRFNFLTTYSELKAVIFPTTPLPLTPTVQEQERELQLIREEQQQKILSLIEEREQQLNQREVALQNEETRMAQEKEAVAKEREALLAQQEQLEQNKQEEQAYELKVANLATRFFEMPPQRAVERIIALSDDLLIIDVLEQMDKVAANRGQQSIVPFLFSLMPPEDAARILEKSTISL